MTLREQMESDIEAVFLNTDEHAETVSYRARDSQPRDVTAIIDEDGLFQEDTGHQKQQDTIDIFVSRAADGIPNPQTSDTVSFARGDETVTYVYQGTVMDGDEFGWWLRFRRTQRKKISQSFEQANG